MDVEKENGCVEKGSSWFAIRMEKGNSLWAYTLHTVVLDEAP